MPTTTTTTPTLSQTTLPPTTIPPQPNHHLPSLSHPFPLPTTWRCGTCTTLQPIHSLLSLDDENDTENTTCCTTPALQAVYDQSGALFLFWRDDPAVSDLRVPRMAEEARWRVRMAGGGVWDSEEEGINVGRGRGLS